MSLIFGFSGKTRAMSALMLAAMMGLGGTAFGAAPPSCYDEICGPAFSSDYDAVHETITLEGITMDPQMKVDDNVTIKTTDYVDIRSATLLLGTDSSVVAGGGVTVERNAWLKMEAGSSISTDYYVRVGIGSDNDSNAAIPNDRHRNYPSTLLLLGDASIDGTDTNITTNIDFNPNGGGLSVEKYGIVDVGTNTLSVTGDAIFLTGSIYKLTGTDSDNGLITVTGKVTSGGYLDVEWMNVEGTSGNYHKGGAAGLMVDGFLDIGDTVMTAGSFVAGTDGLIFNSPIYTFVVNGSNLVVSGISADNAIESLGQNSNYAASGGLINNIFSSAGISQELKNRLADNLQQIGFTDGELAEIAMKQLIGEEALAAASAIQSSISQGNQALGQHFQALRGQSSPAAGAGDAENRLWVGGFGQWSQQDDADKVYGYDYNSVGLMLGYDHEVAALPGLTLGLNGSWNSGTVENNDGLAETDIDSFGLGLYGLYEFSTGFFIEGDLGYGHAENDSEIRLALGGRKSGDFDVDSFQAGLNLGYDFRFDNGAILTPSAGLRYTHIKQDGWRESIVSDPNNLAVANWFDDSTQNFLEFPINLKLAKTFETQGGATITPELRVGAVFTANDPESSLRMGFVGSNDSVTIYGIDPGRSRFTAGARIKAQLNDTVDLFADYDLEARSGYTGHSASLGLGVSF